MRRLHIVVFSALAVSCLALGGTASRGVATRGTRPRHAAAENGPAPRQGERTVKGHPGHRYRPLADWSKAVEIAKVDPEEVDSFATNFAKVVAITGRVEQDRICFRVRFADQLQTYFAAQPASTAEIPYGVWFHLYLDVDPATSARRPERPEQGADIEIQVSGSTGSDGSYRVSGWHDWIGAKAKAPPLVPKGQLDPERNLSYGADAVEFFLPRTALPAGTADVIRLVGYQNVKAGDREAALLQGTLNLK
jgi:hypothetical protein